MTATPNTFELADFEHDELTQLTFQLNLTVTSWPQDVRDGVVEILEGLAMVCAVRESADCAAAADLLTLARRIIRAAEQHRPIRTSAPSEETEDGC